MAEVTYYGADWCVYCRRSKAFMLNHDVEFVENNVEGSSERAAKAESIAGRKNIPVIQCKDGAFLVEPSDADLQAALAERGLI
jgi:glutaredoxin